MSKKKPVEIKMEGISLSMYPSGVFEGKVSKSGNGAVIPFYKKFLGKEVIILVKGKIVKETKSFKELMELMDGQEVKYKPHKPKKDKPTKEDLADFTEPYFKV